MYATCLFCNGALGTNEAIEEFSVGRRLAFDAEKGRLWVVCRRCERWNLTPLEERWEAIESCERAFRDTKLRVSTGEIGLARLHEGLELVRIGAPLRPEMAAWRYGDQFGRRRRKALLLGGGAALAIGGWGVASTAIGLAAGSAMLGVHLFNVGNMLRGAHSIAARIPMGDDAPPLIVQRDQVAAAVLRIGRHGEGPWSLEIKHRPVRPAAAKSWRLAGGSETHDFTGDDAIRAARQLLPVVNASGASRRTVREAVTYLELTPEPALLFAAVARHVAWVDLDLFAGRDRLIKLTAIPAAARLALEMSAHEDVERRALEGELHLLEQAWRDAEEIAAIADDLFLPPSVNENMTRLKNDGA